MNGFLPRCLIAAALIGGLLSGCAGPARQVTPTPAPAVTRTSAATPTARATPAPSPTALALPTSSSPEATPAPEGQPAPPTPAPTATGQPPTSPLLDQYLPKHAIIAETQHFIFYAQDNYFPADRAWMTAEAETLYAYVSQRLQAQAKEKILVAFMRPDTRSCPVRGLTSPEKPATVLIYADEKSTQAYLLGVLSHELGHAIPAEAFPGGLPDDLALTEGLASWASGKYWAAWFGAASLDDIVRGYIAAGQYEPIHENYDLHGVYPWQNPQESSAGCLARRDKIYSEWADFLGYLIEHYGWDKAMRLFHNPPPQHRNGQVISFPPDYLGIYGKALNQLEFEWLEELKSASPSGSLSIFTRAAKIAREGLMPSGN